MSGVRRRNEVELSALHLQGHAGEHGVVHAALRVRVLESGAGDGRGRAPDRWHGHLGRLTSLADLPPRTTLIAWTKKAAALNDAGVKVPRQRKTPRKPLRTPA